MNTQLSTFSRALALSILGGTLLAVTAEAKIVSQSKDIVIEQPTDLPELARRMGIALQLYSETGDGSTYLYVEQHQGQRLLVLNVTDPTRIKMIAAVPLSAPAPFDFVGPVGGSSLLVRFRNNEGMAVLDLKHARLPVLSKVNGLQSSVFSLQSSVFSLQSSVFRLQASGFRPSRTSRGERLSDKEREPDGATRVSA
jgi:hypothetical protein